MDSIDNPTYRIPLITPDLGQPTPEELAWIVSHQVPSPNRVVDAFEKHMRHFAGRDVLATHSGTSALHLALATLGIAAGDEVLCSDFTFAATINAIIYTGATPTLLDSEPDTWGMDPELLHIALRQRARSGKLPKAVILTHVLGHAAQLDKIMALCQEYHVWLIEDAAGGLGSTFRGKPLGTWADAGVWSFNYNKILTTGGGGALISSVSSLHDRATYLANQAKTKKSFYFHKEVGYNYKINGIGAGIGALSWPSLPDKLKGKRQVRRWYQEALANCESVRWQQATPDSEPNYWLNGILLPSREMRKQVQTLLLAEGIEVARLWKPMHQQPAYQSVPFMGNGTGDILFEQGLALPSDATLTHAQVLEVCQRIEAGLATATTTN